ncbi:MAG: hypothetical protein ACTSUN_00315 [Promethearchaeota archaeon]
MDNSLKNLLKQAKKKKNADQLNDLLIELGKNPHPSYLELINDLLDQIDFVLLDKIIINLVYFLGEFGKIHKIPRKHIEFLQDIYYKSDRWVRSEIMSALNNITIKNTLQREDMNLIKSGLKEEYDKIKIQALKCIQHLEKIPNEILKEVFLLLDSSSQEIIEMSSNIIKTHVRDEVFLFKLLNAEDFYERLAPKVFRKIIIAIFDSPLLVPSMKAFKKLISNSSWAQEKKDLFLKEIDTYSNILLKIL